MRAAATQIASRQFDNDFFRLSAAIQTQIQAKLDEMGRRLEKFSHYRMSGSDKYRLRVGDYRVIYRFNAEKGEIYLVALGHRREIYQLR